MYHVQSILKKSLVITFVAFATACVTHQSSEETVQICNSAGCVDRPKGYAAPNSPATTNAAEKNPQIEALKKLAAQDPSAAYDLALRFFRADGVRQDSYQAIQWMRDAAERGNLKAQMALGRLYLTGFSEMGADPGEAERWLAITVSRGDKEAANLLKEATKARRSKQARHQWENRWRPNIYNDWYRNYPYNWQWGTNQWMPMQPIPPVIAPYPPPPPQTGPAVYDGPSAPLLRENKQTHSPTVQTAATNLTLSENPERQSYQRTTDLTATQTQNNIHSSTATASVATDTIKTNQPGTRRIALVIGNGAYQHTGRLSNPVNDAQDMAQALKKNNFQVILKTDATLEAMADAIHHFGENLKGGGIGLFYYSGHGIQVKGENYLLPVDTNLTREDEIKRKAINASDVLEKMGEGKSHLNLVFLDACRNNPFPSSSRGANRGLTSMNAPSGTLLVFSTNPNNVAEDGIGRNGTYTKHLLKYLDQPGLEVGMMLRQVRTKVKEETGGKQIPWENGSIEGTFYFNENSSK